MIPISHLHPRNSTRSTGKIHRHSHQHWNILHHLLQLLFLLPSWRILHACMIPYGKTIINSARWYLLLNLFILHLMVILFNLHSCGDNSDLMAFSPNENWQNLSLVLLPNLCLLYHLSFPAKLEKKTQKTKAFSVSCLPYHSYSLLSKALSWCWLWQVRLLLYPKSIIDFPLPTVSLIV